MKLETIHSQPIYHGRVFDVRVDEVRLPDGRAKKLDIIDHPGAVVIVPIDAQGQVLFIRQYRHAAGVELLELPAGVCEPGEAPEISAARETQEETGMSAEKLQKIGEFYIAPGYSTEYIYIYLATGLFPAPLPPDDDEYITVERKPVSLAYDMAQNGQIHDSKTLAALLLARPHLLA